MPPSLAQEETIGQRSMMELPNPSTRRTIRRGLRAWFRRNQRDLPWRSTRDPYRIWVSEIMLQQTQVATVVPYFERFLRVFPTLATLAGAEESQVLQVWEGLGYYRRARDLLRASRQLVAECGGHIPDDPDVFGRLPGIGRYTMAAILSQAFDRRLPILEANSERLLCRLFGLRADPKRGAARRFLWQLAEVLLPARQVGEFNQALMELGALVCTSAAPRCPLCPLTAVCRAYQHGWQEKIPLRVRPRRPVKVQEVAVIVHRGERVLLAQRPARGRWAALWEFPHAVVNPPETHETAARRVLAELVGLRATIGAELMTLRHSVTHHRITLVALEARYQSGRFTSPFYQRAGWLRPAELRDFPVSSPQRRLADALAAPHVQERFFRASKRVNS